MKWWKMILVLAAIVGAVVLGAFALNVLMPNTTNTLITSFENMVFNATGMSLDFNGDGVGGSAGTSVVGGGNTQDNTMQSTGVTGFNSTP